MKLCPPKSTFVIVVSSNKFFGSSSFSQSSCNPIQRYTTVTRERAMSDQCFTKHARHLLTLPDLCLLTIIDHLPLDTVPTLFNAFTELWALERAVLARRRSVCLDLLDEEDLSSRFVNWPKREHPLDYIEATQPYGRNMVEWVAEMMPNLTRLHLYARHWALAPYDVALMNMVLCARFGQLTHLSYHQRSDTVSNLAILCTVGAMAASRLQELDIDIVLPPEGDLPAGGSALEALPFPVLARLRRFTYRWCYWDNDGNHFDPVAFCRWVTANYANNRRLVICSGEEEWDFEELSMEELNQIYAIPNAPLDQFEDHFYGLSTQDYRLSDLRRYCSRFCSLNQMTIGLTTTTESPSSLWDVLQCLAPMKKGLSCLQIRIYPQDIAPLLLVPVSSNSGDVASQPPPVVVFESLVFLHLVLYDKIDLRPMLCLQQNQLGAIFPNLQDVFVSVPVSSPQVSRPEWSEEERQSLLALEPEFRKLFQHQCPKCKEVSFSFLSPFQSTSY